MRELVYLSQRKLEQFQIDRRGGTLAKRIRGIGMKAPLGMGEVQVDLGDETASRYSKLNGVLKELDRSDRAPQWYEAEDLQSGDWVQFEAPLNFFVLPPGRRDLEPVLMFLQPPTTDTHRNKLRLVLHGSPVHLLGGSHEKPQSAWFSGSGSGQFLRMLEDFVADKDVTSQAPRRRVAELLAWGIFDLDFKFDASTASWMSGYARLTIEPTMGFRVDAGEQNRFLVASPLYVEYVSNPNRDS